MGEADFELLCRIMLTIKFIGEIQKRMCGTLIELVEEKNLVNYNNHFNNYSHS